MKKLLNFNAIMLMIFVLFLCSCGGGDDENITDGDMDNETESSEAVEDGDSDLTVDGDEDLSEDEEKPEGTTISGTNVVIGVGMGIVLTPSAQTADGNYGDGSWQSVENFLTNKDNSNFGYTAEGLELGYGNLSQNVQMAIGDFEVPANNGALLNKLVGPYESRTPTKIDEEKYIYLYITDNDVKYYLRMYYDHKSGLGMHVNYDFSTDPTFP